jgi:phosphate transport system substrate-binding protein
LDFPADSRAMITNSPIENAYPISCLTWIIIYKEQNYSKRTLEQAQETIALLDYLLSDNAQNQTIKVHYAPLPNNVINNAKNALKTVTYNGVNIVQ